MSANCDPGVVGPAHVFFLHKASVRETTMSGIQYPGISVRCDTIRASGNEASSLKAVRPPVDSDAHLATRSPSEFSVIFRSAIPILANDVWLFSVGAFQKPMAWIEDGHPQLDQLHGEIEDHKSPTGGHIFQVSKTKGFLERWAVYVSDDWNEVYGFAEPSPPIDWLIRRCSRRWNDPEVLASCHVYFQCLDGAWWNCYTRDSTLLATIIRDIKSRPNVRFNECALDEFGMPRRT